ncbi:MAG: DUF4166 domain-containing protein [Hyphomicrobium sp.]|uniref:SDR family oxidoreductase n=1 Tax=Hyphomicrobium sp. TaxID=82 RepID=UPI0039E55CD2
MPRRIVLIGATGFFGQRLARRLAQIDGTELVLTSRDKARAQSLADEIGGGGRIASIAFERSDATDIAALAPWLVIDASGPFQMAGYDLAGRAIAAGAHWIDLADARDYLLGFSDGLDSRARAAGVVARAGASSTPALSSAVVEDLTRGWRRIDSIDIAILPGGKGEVGLSVIRAILSYVGRPIATLAEGRPQTVIGWGEARRIAVDGLATRYVSPVETADAALMPERFGVTSRVSFGAGLESRFEQFGILLLAHLRRCGLISNLEPLAPMLARARGLTRPFASDRGGMIVTCTGLDGDCHWTSARWILQASPGQGPDVPILPAVALTRALLRGDEKSGAAVASLALAAIEAEMSAPSLTTSRLVRVTTKPSLIEAACGGGYGDLPSALRAFHAQNAPPVWHGKADIDASRSLTGRLLRWVFGFPPTGLDVDVTVSVDREEGAETWTRNFGGRRFSSRLTHEGGNIVSERFGAINVLLGLEARGGEIAMPVVGWRIGAIRLPLVLAPKSETRESAGDDGRFHFDVAITLPMIGRLAHYRGWLEPKTIAATELAASG